MKGICAKIREHLAARGPMTIAEVADATPALQERGGEERARLLLRLDPGVEATPDGRWRARVQAASDEQKLRWAAERYFAEGKPGETRAKLVAELVRETGIDEPRVVDFIRRSYHTNALYVFNRRKDG